MTLPHFHIPVLDQDYEEGTIYELALDTEVITHMGTLRLRRHERFVLVDPKGRAYSFEVENLTKERVNARFCGYSTYTRPINLTLVQGISKGERMDQTIRQTTELGVARIIPLQSERSIVRLSKEGAVKKQERWQRLACAAADQATCAFSPEITLPLNLTDALKLVSDCDLLLVAWEDFAGQGIRSELEGKESSTRVALFVGPEGGFDTTEIEALNAAGAQLVSLGRTILRTETAAVVASALVLHELGELGNRPL